MTSRLKLVEAQMSTFQSSLQELLQLQRASHPTSTISNRQPTASSATTAYPSQSPSNIMYPPPTQLPQPPPPLVPTPAPPPSMFNMATIEGPPRPYRTRAESVLAQTQYTPPGGFTMDQILSSAKTPAPGIPGPSSSNFPYPVFNRQDHHRPQNTLPPIVSLPPDPPSQSPAILTHPSFLNAEPASKIKRPASPSSSEEEDPDPAIASATFPGPWRSMLSLAEAARLKADNQLTKEEAEGDANKRAPSREAREDGGGPKRHPFDYGQGPDKKRRKSNLGTVEDENTGLRGALPLLRGSQRHAYRDPVELGIIGEGRGRELFES